MSKQPATFFHVTWLYTNSEGQVICAKTKKEALQKYKRYVTDNYTDESMLDCWSQIKKDLVVKKIEIIW